MTSLEAAGGFALQPAGFWLRCISAYLLVLALSVGGTVSLVSRTPRPPSVRPAVGKEKDEVRLGGFQIPFYAEGRLTGILTGDSGILDDDGARNIRNPAFVFFSGEPASAPRLCFRAAAGDFTRTTGRAALRDDVRISSLVRKGEKWRREWTIEGKALLVSAGSGLFGIPGRVEISSPFFHLRGENLKGRFDPQKAQLLEFSFARIYESEWKPDVRK